MTRGMFIAYLTLIIVGLALFVALGLLHR